MKIVRKYGLSCHLLNNALQVSDSPEASGDKSIRLGSILASFPEESIDLQNLDNVIVITIIIQ